MARRRRVKRRKATPQRTSQVTASTMTPDEAHALQSGRQSSEGTLSEPATSEGAQTAMTSILDTDEEMVHDQDEILEVDENIEDEDVDTDGDLQSLYPQTYFAHMPRSHRSEYANLEPASALANSDMAASTRSLWEQDLDYREIHGRLYCREYYSPIDDIELMRQALLNQVFLHVLGGEHTGVQLDNPTNILDVGTGTGEWAIRMAEQYQKCEVVGTDIAAVAETNSVPMNVFFEIEDAEDWDRAPDFYDLIHLRSMEGAFKDWKSIYGNIFYSLKPGGWIEVQDFDAAEGLEKFTDQFPPTSHIHKLLSDLVVAAEKTGRRRGSHHMNPGLFVDSGFVDVRVTEYSIPLSLSEKSAGKLWLIACLDAFEATCLRLLTEQMGWDPDRCKQACESVAREIVDLTKNHPEKSAAMITKVRIVAGRKPVDAPPSVRLGRTPSPNMELHDDDDASTQSMAHQEVSSADTGLAQQSLAPDEGRLREPTPSS